MRSNFWDFLCSATETAGKVAVGLLACATVAAVFGLINIETEDDEE